MLRGRGRGGKHALLLTGLPGVGKTTVARRVAAALGPEARGFTTEEIRVGRERQGFRLETLDGRSTVLARAGLRSPHRVGRYGVDVAALDRVVEEALGLDPTAEMYIIDEIGKMECLSPRFAAAVTTLLEAGRPIVATVSARGGGFMAEVKKRPDAELWTVTRDNRDALPARVLAWLGRG